MHKKLFIPGPIEVAPEVLAKMATPMIGHRSKAASALQKGIADKLRQVFYTQNEIILSTSSGSGLMEGSIRSCTAKRVAVFSVGAFGDRWYKMATANGIPADKFMSELGKATTPEMVEAALSTGKYDVVTVTHNETSTGITNPVGEISDVVKKYPDVVWCVDAVSSAGGTKIEVDKLGIDVCITSSQKAFALPPGLAVCTMSTKAYERAKTVKNRGLYFDLVELYDFVKNKDNQYPSTPSLSHMYALDFQLDRMLAEGLEHRWARHIEMAEIVRTWARKNFALFTDPKYLSNSLTVVSNTRGINVGDLNKELGKRGKEIANGYGDLKEKTFRIAHMGDMTNADLEELLRDIDQIVGL
jgi:predicted phosphoserine aminotransferase